MGHYFDICLSTLTCGGEVEPAAVYPAAIRRSLFNLRYNRSVLTISDHANRAAHERVLHLADDLQGRRRLHILHARWGHWHLGSERVNASHQRGRIEPSGSMRNSLRGLRCMRLLGNMALIINCYT